jgi:ribonuclease P protein component
VLPAAERIKRSSVFQRAYNARKSVSGQLFVLYVLPRTKSTQPLRQARLPITGFVISKKIFKSACRRNRAKRTLREAYRLLRSGDEKSDSLFSSAVADVRQSLHQWYALIFVINEKALNAAWPEICKKMEDSLLLVDKKYGQQAAKRIDVNSKQDRTKTEGIK